MRLHLGSEVEYWAEGEAAVNAISEYYPNQWELNNFHVIGECVDDNIKQLENWSKDIVCRSMSGRMDFGGYRHASGGPVFSGVHFHLQVEGSKRIDENMSNSRRYTLAEKLSQQVSADVLKYHGMTFRGLVSHHVNGAVRASTHMFKQKPKFSPVIYHKQLGTYELRCGEPAMVFTEEGRAALKSILERAYAFLQGEKVEVDSDLANIVYSMRNLPGDFQTNAEVSQYADFTHWIKRRGVRTYYTITSSSCAVEVEYENITAHNNRVRKGPTVYHADLRRVESAPTIGMSLEALVEYALEHNLVSSCPYRYGSREAMEWRHVAIREARRHLSSRRSSIESLVERMQRDGELPRTSRPRRRRSGI